MQPVQFAGENVKIKHELSPASIRRDRIWVGGHLGGHLAVVGGGVHARACVLSPAESVPAVDVQLTAWSTPRRPTSDRSRGCPLNLLVPLAMCCGTRSITA